MAVTHDTRRVMGVKCLVASDRVTEDGDLVEQTYDWYAQDDRGNVWYFGEDVTEYKNGKVSGHEGSWESGVDGAYPGLAMPAHPSSGQTYRQEYSKGVAEDKARVVMLDGSARVPYGAFDHVLVTEEFTPLEPHVVERQYYVAGVGDIIEATVKGRPERIELVDVKHGWSMIAGRSNGERVRPKPSSIAASVEPPTAISAVIVMVVSETPVVARGPTCPASVASSTATAGAEDDACYHDNSEHDHDGQERTHMDPPSTGFPKVWL
jgi:hypothetical protein